MFLISAAVAAPIDLVTHPNGGYSFSFGTRIHPLDFSQIHASQAATLQVPLIRTVPVRNLAVSIPHSGPILTPLTRTVPAVNIQTSAPRAKVTKIVTEKSSKIAQSVTSVPRKTNNFAGIPPSPLFYIALAMPQDGAPVLPTVGHF